MTPRNRLQKLIPYVMLGLVLVWALGCFLAVLSPRLHRLAQASKELAGKGEELAGIRREIENARIVGPPAEPGKSRFEKFGILARDEEQLFLQDLIGFCNETGSDLNLVRRSEYARRAAATTEEAEQQEAGQPTTPPEGKKKSAEQAPVIDRVPHTVSFSGNFRSAFDLLRKLESYKRLLTVERVELAVDSREGYPRLNGNIVIDLYLARVPARGRGEQPAGAGEPSPGRAGAPGTATGGAGG